MRLSFHCCVLSLFAFILLTDGIKFRCDYTYSSEIKGWQKHHKVPATWNDARLMCAIEGGILASPSTTELSTFMVGLANTSEILTGLRATFSRGSYYTIDGIPLDQIIQDQTLLQLDNKNNKENCLALQTEGKFIDVDCDEPRPYVCYRAKTEEESEVDECGTPDPEYSYDKRTKKCYKLHTVPRNYHRAHFTCSAEGGHLAIINSDQEATVLRELFAKYPPARIVGNFWKDVAFVGFHNWGEGGDWRTIHGQTLNEAGYARFSPGEPNNSTTGEYCGAIYRTAYLNDLWCENEYAFICEKSKNYPSVCDSTG
ncbi:unnamed protein product [Arctia plantaginis]|uniref:C-type lectin domain-containing protein n=1 Tax=Arctia plantaginis TaxID=874455 RepID=A0A8S0YT80_ARCPL|nr:unnamed protein product [Arctia plantaginis]